MDDIGWESFVIRNNICLYNRKKIVSLLYGTVSTPDIWVALL